MKINPDLYGFKFSTGDPRYLRCPVTPKSTEHAMDFETLAGIYTYAMDHHTGQWSRLYSLMCRINMQTRDEDVFTCINGNRHSRQGIDPQLWNEWTHARSVYRKLKRRNAQ